MTAATLLGNALALLLTTSAQTPEYAESALPVINMLLGEISVYNDMARRSTGKPPLEKMMRVDGMEDELPCEEIFAVTALPNGLCAKLLIDDDDMAKVAWFQNQYIQAINDAAKAIPVAIVDCYPGGDGA